MKAETVINPASDDFEINNDNKTLCGELVYLKSDLDFNNKSKANKRDCVLEENLLDVKRLLKNSAFGNANNHKKPDPNDPDAVVSEKVEKKQQKVY